jgi:hypothetical protein
MSSAVTVPKAVAFSQQHQIHPISPRRHPRKSTLNMDQKLYEKFHGAHVTNEMLQEAAELFSENYGVWGELAAAKMGKFAKAGKHSTLK